MVISFGSILELPLIRIKFIYLPSSKSRSPPLQFTFLVIKFFSELKQLQRSHFFFVNFVLMENPFIGKSEISNFVG